MRGFLTVILRSDFLDPADEYARVSSPLFLLTCLLGEWVDARDLSGWKLWMWL